MPSSFKYSIDALIEDNDSELLSKLKNAWGYKSHQRLKIVGKLTEITLPTGNNIYFLTSLRSSNDFSKLEYPIQKNADGKNIDTVFVPPSEGKNAFNYFEPSDFAIAYVEFSPKSERIKKQNPFALMSVGNIDLLTDLPFNINELPEINGKTYLEKEIFNCFLEKNRKEIENEEQKDIARIKGEIEEQVLSISEQKINLEQNVEGLQATENDLGSSIQNLENKRDIIDKNITEAKEELMNKGIELEELTKSYISRKNRMETNLSRLNHFVKAKADKLISIISVLATKNVVLHTLKSTFFV